MRPSIFLSFRRTPVPATFPLVHLCIAVLRSLQLCRPLVAQRLRTVHSDALQRIQLPSIGLGIHRRLRTATVHLATLLRPGQHSSLHHRLPAVITRASPSERRLSRALLAGTDHQ